MAGKFDEVGGVYVRSEAMDGNAVEFSCAPVGAHINNPDLSAKYTATKPAGATGLLVQNVGTAAITFTLDGTDPTNTLGFQLPASMQAPLVIPCPGTAIEFIRVAAGANLQGQWVK